MAKIIIHPGEREYKTVEQRGIRVPRVQELAAGGRS